MKTKKSLLEMIRDFVKIKEVGVFLPLLLMLIVFSIANPSFLSAKNLAGICRGLAYLGIVAVGETLVILVGEIDISVGSVAGFGAAIGTFLAVNSGVNLALAILIAIFVCGLIGLFNGILIVKYKLPAFIITIGMMYIAEGAMMIVTKGKSVYPLPEIMKKVGSAQPFGTSVAFVVFLVLIVAFEFILRKTSFGRSVYAVGDNIGVAKLAGIPVNRVKISLFVITSMLAGVSGLLLAGQLETGSPSIGSGWELQVVAGTAIGGASLLGGSGSMIGTLIGIFVLGVLNNGLVFLGLDAHWQTVAIGAVMILAVFADIIGRNKKIGG